MGPKDASLVGEYVSRKAAMENQSTDQRQMANMLVDGASL